MRFTQAELDNRYGSHQPVLRALVNLLKPQSCVELGSGNFSTPFFYNNVPQLISIENDPDWLHHILGTLAPRTNFIPLLHWLGQHIDKETLAKKLTVKDITLASLYYNCLRTLISQCLQSPRMLFIDQYMGFRELSYKILGPRFDCVVMHDTECKHYHYETLEGYHRYRFTMYNVSTDYLVKGSSLDISSHVIANAKWTLQEIK